MFVGRKPEREALQAAWARAQEGSPQLAVVWGRRRVGKTYLLSEFTSELPTIFFTATRNFSETDQLNRLFEATQRGLGDRSALAGGGFRDLESALRFFLQMSIDHPLVVVLDEAPRLGSARADFGDVLAAVWDQRPLNARLLLIICGSAVAAMRDLIGPEGGLYRRADPELRIDPLDPWEAAELLGKQISGDALVQAYAACGGYPLHLAAWNPELSVEKNLLALAGSPGGLLLRDALDIMFEDLDFRSGYERVLGTMGNGPIRRSKIASRAQQRIDQTLKQLQRSGYVVAERPLGAPITADPLYRLVDPYVRFWFAVLRADAELIDGGQGESVLRRVAPQWEAHVQSVFEEVARLHAIREVTAGRLPQSLVGRWWKDETVEIDVLGLDDGSKPVLVGEAKWQSQPVTVGQISQLRAAATHLENTTSSLELAVWSRNGVTSDAAAFPDVTVYTPDNMFL